jgi:hypothetical protein
MRSSTGLPLVLPELVPELGSWGAPAQRPGALGLEPQAPAKVIKKIGEADQAAPADQR